MIFEEFSIIAQYFKCWRNQYVKIKVYTSCRLLDLAISKQVTGWYFNYIILLRYSLSVFKFKCSKCIDVIRNVKIGD